MKQEIQQNFTKKEYREAKRQEKKEAQEKLLKNKKIKKIILWGVVTAVIVGSIAGVIYKVSTSKEIEGGVLSVAITEIDWVKGNPESSIVLVEYSDFQCPACASYYPIIKRLDENFGDRIQIVYRHFPLKSIHKNAEPAAQAAEAAGAQGKFWEMHDMIFENQTLWSNERNPKDTFLSYAEALSLNLESFENDYESSAVAEKIRSDANSGFKSGVNSTPSFFLNGEKIENPRGYENFAQVIEQTIAR